MNAEELAVKMEMGNHDWADEAANMLRQQQAEIEKLGSELDRIVELYTDKAIENEALRKKIIGYHLTLHMQGKKMSGLKKPMNK